MITAEKSQRHLALLRQDLVSNHHHDASKVVEVVAYDHLHHFTAAHGSIDLLEEGNWTLIACNTRAGLQFHIIDVPTWRTAGRKKCEWILY